MRQLLAQPTDAVNRGRTHLRDLHSRNDFVMSKQGSRNVSRPERPPRIGWLGRGHTSAVGTAVSAHGPAERSGHLLLRVDADMAAVTDESRTTGTLRALDDPVCGSGDMGDSHSSRDADAGRPTPSRSTDSRTSRPVPREGLWSVSRYALPPRRVRGREEHTMTAGQTTHRGC